MRLHRNMRGHSASFHYWKATLSKSFPPLSLGSGIGRTVAVSHPCFPEALCRGMALVGKTQTAVGSRKPRCCLKGVFKKQVRAKKSKINVNFRV